jgi:hypothetical protein
VSGTVLLFLGTALTGIPGGILKALSGTGTRTHFGCLDNSGVI